MTNNEIKATLAKVDADVRASTQHTAALRRGPAIDDGACTDPRCTNARCSCQRRSR
jgi:hypothetical protein